MNDNDKDNDNHCSVHRPTVSSWKLCTGHFMQSHYEYKSYHPSYIEFLWPLMSMPSPSTFHPNWFSFLLFFCSIVSHTRFCLVNQKVLKQAFIGRFFLFSFYFFCCCFLPILPIKTYQRKKTNISNIPHQNFTCFQCAFSLLKLLVFHLVSFFSSNSFCSLLQWFRDERWNTKKKKQPEEIL